MSQTTARLHTVRCHRTLLFKTLLLLLLRVLSKTLRRLASLQLQDLLSLPLLRYSYRCPPPLCPTSRLSTHLILVLLLPSLVLLRLG